MGRNVIPEPQDKNSLVCQLIYAVGSFFNNTSEFDFTYQTRYGSRLGIRYRGYSGNSCNSHIKNKRKGRR